MELVLEKSLLDAALLREVLTSKSAIVAMLARTMKPDKARGRDNSCTFFSHPDSLEEIHPFSSRPRLSFSIVRVGAQKSTIPLYFAKYNGLRKSSMLSNKKAHSGLSMPQNCKYPLRDVKEENSEQGEA